LMLSVLLFLAGYFAYARSPGNVWWVAVSVGLVSAYGQLYNQLRDYEADRAAGLRNTASLLGRQATRRLMVACLGGAALSLAATVVIGLWPLWLVPVAVALSPLVLVFHPGTDMRGTQAVDASGRLQPGAMALANVIVMLWLIETMIH